MTWTDWQLNDAEEAVEKLSNATNLEFEEIIDVIHDGFSMKYKGSIPDHIYELIDELRATFDCL